MIVRFADYGFPRAHAAAYGVLAFQTAYLKAHYPVQFMASMLTAVMGSHRKVAEYVVECRRMDIAVLPPDVNESRVLFTPLQQGSIRFGLAAIKNVGTQAMESILAVRKERPFDSLLDFCRRVDLRVCNKRVIESLIQAGAFDSLTGHRAQLLAMLDETVDAAVKWRKERDDLQIDMFGFVEMPNWDIEYPNVPKFSASQQLELERELLGLYLSGHPLDDFESLLENSEADRLMELGDVPDETVVVTAGMVVSLKTITTKQGKAMAFIELEDQIERCEVVLFPEVWKRSQQWIEKGLCLRFEPRCSSRTSTSSSLRMRPPRWRKTRWHGSSSADVPVRARPPQLEHPYQLLVLPLTAQAGARRVCRPRLRQPLQLLRLKRRRLAPWRRLHRAESKRLAVSRCRSRAARS